MYKVRYLMFQYYFRVYKRNKEFKSRKDQSHYMSFINFHFYKKKNFFQKKIHIVNYSSEKF